MRETLSGDTGRQAVTLQGLGGIGKTQLAIAYAKAHRKDYSAIFWVNIKDEESAKQSYSRLARRISQEYPSISPLSRLAYDSKPDEIVEAVKRWLERAKNIRWLMVFDNYDTPKVPGSTDPSLVNIWKFLPEAHHGAVIVTTRSSKVNIGHRIKVGKLEDIRDSLQILSDISHREGVIDDPDAAELAKELDGLPLALATAGAYLDQVATSFTEYLRLYRVSWLRLQHATPELSTYEDRQLYSTWQVSLDHIKRQNELSAKLLQLWAYFDNQDLWFELLREGSTLGSEWLCQLTEDELCFNQVVRVLCDHGLIEVDQSSGEGEVESKGYAMHSCVHSWTVHMLNQEWDSRMAEFALHCIARHLLNKNTQNSWVLQRRPLRHLAKCCDWFLDGRLDDDGREWFLYAFGYVHSYQGRFEEAEKMYLRALAGHEKARGPEDTFTLDMVHNLGMLYTDQGRLDEAEKMYQRALQGYKKAFGPDNIRSTLVTVNNLGTLYATQGKLAEADKMFIWALQGYEKIPEPTHKFILTTVHNLGRLYMTQGKSTEAEEMFARALQGKEKAFGLKHKSTLSTINNLGLLYLDQDKLHGAESMFTRAMQGYEEAVGLKHISILDTINNLGVVYTKQGRLAEAEKMFTRALQGTEEAVGSKHMLTLTTMNDLGKLRVDQNKLDEAGEIYMRALQGWEETVGPKHISTLSTISNLGALYAKQGELSKAEELNKRALQGYEEVLGSILISSHVPALNTMVELANLFSTKNENELARTMYLKALPGFTMVQGSSSNACREIEHKLAVLDLLPVTAGVYNAGNKMPVKRKSIPA
ncbi:TPR-like protein [Tothia fuscella]|uniref:TPR-like protein n=1 Tax=Tothia fuscella TaxID=1048955 RepID=A0A9P4P026_9PEZI|nr:TPR-like protein [Tothia fuscella]